MQLAVRWLRLGTSAVKVNLRLDLELVMRRRAPVDARLRGRPSDDSWG